MYSVIPMPVTEWKREHLRHVMNAFPFVGIVIGSLMYIFIKPCFNISLPPAIRAVILTFIPVLITGGIHLDGYIDTIDALSSHKPRADKLKILKDPHVGAFSMIRLCFLLLFIFAFWFSLPETGLPPLLCRNEFLLFTMIYFYSRSLSGLSVLTFPLAEGSGLARTFSGEEEGGQNRIDKKAVAIQTVEVILGLIILCLSGILGTLAAITGVIMYLYYRRISVREFGGVNGDQAGWFLTKTEAWITVVIVSAAIILV